uniref:hypothetical protein n=1 Tax=Ornithobacterium rhinotracheale TaxID=28251 RepID=UPI0039A576CF
MTDANKVGEDQNSLLLYVTQPFASPANKTGKYEQIDQAGYYYYDAKDNGGKWKKLGTNLYNSNGTLSEERVVDLNGNKLHLDNGETTISANSGFPLIVNSTNDGGGGIAIHPNDWNKHVELSTTKEGDFRLSMDGKGDVVQIPKSTVDLISAGEYLKVKGNGDAWAYISGNELFMRVLVGSTNAEVQDVALWNPTNRKFMRLYSGDILSKNIAVNLWTASEALDVGGKIRSTELRGPGDRLIYANSNGVLHRASDLDIVGDFPAKEEILTCEDNTLSYVYISDGGTLICVEYGYPRRFGWETRTYDAARHEVTNSYLPADLKFPGYYTAVDGADTTMVMTWAMRIR